METTRHLRIAAVALGALGLTVATGLADTAIDFGRQVRPILSDYCFACHGPDQENRKAGLRLDLKETALGDHEGIIPFVAGDLESSEAWLRIISEDPDEVMPPPEFKKPMKAEDRAVLEAWLQAGAPWDEHWAFIAPQRPPLPVSADPTVIDPIDRFLHRELQAQELDFSPEADRRTLLRRITFDLTGLPPTLEEIEDFLNDGAPNAYDRVVERLLGSQRFGERMAGFWLDAARYGDTSVFHADGYRDMWAWRDWVIRAYNRNMPYDEFSIDQLAGDLRENATLEQQLASGFNRNNGTTDEGGAIAEEYRVEYAVDRVRTTSMVWMGLSMECAQCHDHKYDPISHEDYYEFYAFFNVSADKGMQTRGGNAEPKLNIPDPEKEKLLPGHLEAMEVHRALLGQRELEAKPLWANWLATQDQADNATWVSAYPEEAIRRFEMDEGSGGEFKDARDDKKKGFIRGKQQWVDTAYGKGVKLSGENHLEIPEAGALNASTAWTVRMRLRLAPESSGLLISKQDEAGENDPTSGLEARVVDGKLRVALTQSWPGDALAIQTVEAPPTERWIDLAIVYNGETKADGLSVHLDGRAVKTEVLHDQLTGEASATENLRLGSEINEWGAKGTIDAVEVHDSALGSEALVALAKWTPITKDLAVPAPERTEEQNDRLFTHYLKYHDAPHQELTREMRSLEARENELRQPLTSVMVMADMDAPRETFILNRGAYDQPTDHKVTRNTPDALPPMAEGLPRNRLGLAKWLFQEDQPLTPRVAVNQIWTQFFGAGLVRTPADFGSQGAFPTHPELLDWLAVEFRESDWNLKDLIRSIVTSRAYKQSSRVSPGLLDADPENIWLARSPRFRLQAEFIRDNAMSVSGLLLNKMGGPGVKPYQPAGLWKEVGLSGRPIFQQDHGDKLYRRSVYTYWKRSAPPPNMQIFDAPTREKCLVQRPRTNTPLQALVTMNDIQYIEAAQGLARRLITEGGATPQERFTYGYELTTAHRPSQRATEAGLQVYQAAFDTFSKNQTARDEWLAVGELGIDPEAFDPTDRAAWTVVANLLLNLDATLTRE